MNSAQVENNLHNLVINFSKETFIYELLLSYGFPKSVIARLKKGTHNLSKCADQIILKKKLLFQEVLEKDLHATIDALRRDEKISKHNPRFLIVTDYETLLSVDTKTQGTLDIGIKEIAKYFDFFLPWAGMEKAQNQIENPADVKAAERMAKLFDEIKNDNPSTSPEFIHSLNVFLSRLLFCFFAEDTEIFDKGQFTKAISSHTQSDGSDLKDYLIKLFEVLNTEKNKRRSLPVYLEAFPYVNGGLFRIQHQVPIFTRRSRQAIIESGELDWSTINPDIFGSMIQAVITPEHRGGLGMHYTSVPNIMKVIEPLFLNELYEKLEQAKGNNKQLILLLERLKKIRIFDPACGSGNFLIIAYKELRKLEMKIFKEAKMFAFSGISLSQFFGIEIDDFAHEVAMLSLWLAEHQMNVAFFKEFGRTNPALPLKESGRIVQGNATCLNWEDVCPKKVGDEIYIMGNPPYQGARKQDQNQKKDIDFVFKGLDAYKNLDYIACWFYKAATYIKNSNNKFAFVSTNSICQGEQVELIWPSLLNMGLEINFAYHSFKWVNNAKAIAGVSVIIVGMRNISNENKFIYAGSSIKLARNINPYLLDASNLIIPKRKKSISGLPKMSFGNMPNDGGHLILSTDEANQIMHSYPESKKLIRRLIGSDEFINSLERWCLWVTDADLPLALKIPPIKMRIELTKIHRLKSKDKGTNKLALRAHQFRDLNTAKEHVLIVPRVSSENREYFPIGFLNSGPIVLDSALAIYDAELYLMGVIFSKLHNVWVRNIGGKLETRIRYSIDICFNNFPMPDLTVKQKDSITNHTSNIIAEREKYSEKTMADLYDSDEMPNSLREAHHQLDLAVERCYRSKPFDNDEERLEYLFKLYEKMVTNNKSNNGEFMFDEPALKMERGK